MKFKNFFKNYDRYLCSVTSVDLLLVDKRDNKVMKSIEKNKYNVQKLHFKIYKIG